MATGFSEAAAVDMVTVDMALTDSYAEFQGFLQLLRGVSRALMALTGSYRISGSLTGFRGNFQLLRLLRVCDLLIALIHCQRPG